MLHPISFETIITINVTNSTQSLQIVYYFSSSCLLHVYCEFTKIKMLNLLKVLHGRRKKVAHLYYFSHIRNELVSYRICLVKSCF